VLLAVSVGAILLAGLQLLVSRQQLPAGSSYSAQPDGLRGLYEWTQSLGARPTRLVASSPPEAPATKVLLVVEPETFFSDPQRTSLDEVAWQGGTLVLAGQSFFTRAYASALGVTLEPTRTASSVFEPGASASLPIVAHDRVRAADATPLLVSTDGADWLALRKPYLNGTLVVLATSEPLTNAGLGDDSVARFVYQTLGLDTLTDQSIAFEEAHHSFAPPAATAPITLRGLAYDTLVGRALLYAGGVVFAWLVLSGRRLGPPLPTRGAALPGRTMFEHVQTLAGLYRRARQLAAAREAFSRHYARVLAHAAEDQTPALRDALRAIEQARSEDQLVAAVARADEAAGKLSRRTS
jgi:Domain of unknown function (DUF4350)